MRHSIQLEGSRSLKGQSIYIPFQIDSTSDNSLIKIQQNNHSIYCRQQMFKNNIQEQSLARCKKGAQINSILLTLNNLQESTVLIKRVKITQKLKRITIQVNQLDWKIIHNKMALFQSTFLDQISIVWHDARLPLFYDQSNQNYVTLYPLVHKPCLIDPYAAVQFTIKKQTKQNSEDEEEKEPFSVRLKLKQQNELILKNGYDNIIKIDYENYSKLNNLCKTHEQSQERQLFTIQNACIFTKAPNFQQYLAYSKSQQSKNDSNLFIKSLVQILSQEKQIFERNSQIQQFQQQQLEEKAQERQNNYFTISKFCTQSCHISQEIKLSEQQKFVVGNTKTIQMLIKQSKSWKIIIQNMDSRSNSNKNNKMNIQNNSDTINTQQVKNNKENQQLFEKQSQIIKESFCHFLIQELINKGSFIFYQNYYPFFLDGRIYGLKLIQNNVHSPPKNKTNNSQIKLDQFIQIKNCGFQMNEQNDIFTQLLKIIQYNDCNIQNNELSLIENEICRKWIKLINFIEKQKNEHQNFAIFDRMYSQAHKDSLNQVYKFINQQNNSKSDISILITSYSSNGKTYLFKHLGIIGHKSWYMDMKQLMETGNSFDDIKNYLTTFVSQSIYKYLFLDNIDYFLPHIDDSDIARKKQGIIASILGQYLIKLVKNFNKKIIVTSKSSQTVHKNIKFNKMIKLKNPNRQMRAKLIQIMHKDLQFNSNQSQSQSQIQSSLKDKQKLIDHTESYSLGSFAKYCIGMILPTNVKPLAKKNDFTKIAGLKYAKNIIKSVIQKPNKYGFIYEKVKIKVPRGILLYGATGNGKSALGYSLEDQFSMKFFSIKGSDILSKYIGGSQAAVRQVFEKAMSVSPSIIFFDQFESIVPRRNSSGTGVTDRVVNQFLCYLDGVSQTTGVFIIAASSRPDLIDPALLRPGRIDSHVHIDYPNQQQRGELLQIFKQSVDIDQDRQTIIKLTQSYSYCDLIGLLKQLRIKQSASVLKQYKNKQQNLQAQDFKKISKQLFFETIQAFRLATETQQKKRQDTLYNNFKNGVAPDVKKQKFIQM